MATKLGTVCEDEVLEDDRLPANFHKPRMGDSLLDFKALTIGEQIGSGAFSKVFRGTFEGKTVAIKQMVLADKDAAKYLETELGLLSGCEHDNLLKYYGASLKGKEVYIVTQFMDGGDLHSLVCNDKIPLPWRLRTRIARDALAGLTCLHEMGVVHRDIKTENILVNNDWTPVIADYGFARKTNKGAAMTICGTDDFMAPEVIFGEVYDEKADIFSFGVVLWEMIYRKQPGKDGFCTRHPRTKFQLDCDELEKGAPSDTPTSLINLAKACCAYEPEHRLASEEALEWLESLTEELEASSDDKTPWPLAPSEYRNASTRGKQAHVDPIDVYQLDPHSSASTIASTPAGDPGLLIPTPAGAAK